MTQRYMHLSPSATEDAIRLLDDRLIGIAPAVFRRGDSLETGEVASGSSSAAIR
jgi:hypothetical protein